ncbi:PREDICTED: (DL)-glycerol-3-phosphatase 1-like [Priapulus caudatus]|uniref:(DL)-glycerol-3-phosphatase 1-like n=1 Tax=Priapulus caudatus TaxID=37621 RepID=A0ABM1F5K5_PRICU|nr:PREDICTED: (DL)-glycerol-3-phosphatase 1-like [Priapulus caudatus]
MSAASASHVTNITHVIFDLDGLLLNTEDIYSEVANELIRRYHPEKTFSWNVKVKMMGRGPNDAIQILLAEMGLPLTIAEYAAESSKMYEKRFSKAKPLPGRISDGIYYSGPVSLFLQFE